jgi:hypothetical protein
MGGTGPCDDMPAFMKFIGKSSVGSLFPKMWKALSAYIGDWESQGFENLVEMLGVFWNVANMSPKLCVTLGKCGGISLLFDGLKQMVKVIVEQNVDDSDEEKVEYMTVSIFGLLHNAIRLCPANVGCYRKSNAVHIMNGFLELDEVWHLFALFILAYVATDEEKKELASTETGVSILIQILEKAVSSKGHMADLGFSAFEILDAINKLAINDEVKNTIADEEGIPFIVRMLRDDFSAEEQEVAADTIWNLAFIESIRQSDILQATIPSK